MSQATNHCAHFYTVKIQMVIQKWLKSLSFRLKTILDYLQGDITQHPMLSVMTSLVKMYNNSRCELTIQNYVDQLFSDPTLIK